ncbi:monofunctional biosynthetic peptidoglycan transglycosylase [Klebsiella pneumoniae]|uniref:Monofunctional biosynthetic peptidoglycan transglycosylase n=1 Tax=Klebsiella pneumoniae TaxID=573 RepID=A0A447RSG6_KLEPN|nr:monofunctional biosynthetic peptidoglycan transglycosylase [Klebsiella pneumoniae]
MRLRVAPLALLKRLALRLLLIAAVLWGGGIALFSVLPVPFSAVMLERQVSAWLSGDFHYLAHSDWVAMDKISPWMGAGGDCRRRSEVPGTLGVRRVGD